MTALPVGPTLWVVRDRMTLERRENLGYVLAGFALFVVPLVVGVGLITGGLGLFYYEGMIRL